MSNKCFCNFEVCRSSGCKCFTVEVIALKGVEVEAPDIGPSHMILHYNNDHGSVLCVKKPPMNRINLDVTSTNRTYPQCGRNLYFPVCSKNSEWSWEVPDDCEYILEQKVLAQTTPNEENKKDDPTCAN